MATLNVKVIQKFTRDYDIEISDYEARALDGQFGVDHMSKVEREITARAQAHLASAELRLQEEYIQQ